MSELGLEDSSDWKDKTRKKGKNEKIIISCDFCGNRTDRLRWKHKINKTE